MDTNQNDIEVGRNTSLTDTDTDTGGVDTGRRPRSYRLIIAVTGFLIVAGVVTVVVIVSSGDSSLSSRAISCKEDSPSATPMQLNACLKLNCTFDLSTCGENCPFGYELDKSGCEYSCECAGEGLFEGDISFSEIDLMELTKVYGYFIPESDFSTFSGSAYTGKLWTDTTIKGRHKISYEMSSVTPRAEVAMREAMKRFGEQTCIDFVERTNEDMYFIFASGDSCRSVIGKYEAGQEVTIASFCENPESVQHELLHLLGFYHEQSRPDRDSYVIIHKDNIMEGMAHNFKKRMESEVKGFGSEYDLTSVLHYESDIFSKDWRYTITKREDNGFIGLHVEGGFTKQDLYEVNALYNCLENDNSAEWSVWTQWSDCDKTCGNGEQTRNRNCLKGEELVSGCEGEKIEKSVCQAQACPSLEGVWSSWGEWSECSNDCGSGVRWRQRTCTPEGTCKGDIYTGDLCDRNLCAKPSWGLWTTWNSCSLTCGGGWTVRERQCTKADGTSANTCDSYSRNTTDIRERMCNIQECGSADQCEFTVSGICYWSYFILNAYFDFDQAQQICAVQGSVPAYFPTELAYTSAMTNLRSKLTTGGSRATNVITGIMLDAQTSEVAVPDIDIYMKWYPGYPSTKCENCTSVYIYVMNNPSSDNQGMWNHVSTFASSAVVCQKNQN